MSDNFKGFARGLTSPAALHTTVVPSDTTDLNPIPRALYCAQSGSAVLRDAAGTPVTYQLVAGQILPLRAVRVLATGTTATLIGWE